MAEIWADNRTAVRNAPSKPYMTDQWEPTDDHLWQKVLNVARGRKRQMTRVGPKGPRTIHAPNHGRGFRHWPNQKAVAWAVKQYKGYGGKWKGRNEEGEEEVTTASVIASLTRDFPNDAFQQEALERMRLGSILTVGTYSQEHRWLDDLSLDGFTRLIKADEERRESYWEITAKGLRRVIASLGDELTAKMDRLLYGEYDLSEARKIAAWFQEHFRFKSPKTPKGQKDLKALADKLWWFLANGEPTSKPTVEIVWHELLPNVSELVRAFSSEGGTKVPTELRVGSTTYYNRAGLNADTLEKYAKRLERIWGSVRGWRAKALPGLKVAFVSPREMTGTSTGKYKSDQDTLLVRTTPAVLKRGDGYASFDYILLHELGHRYEAKNRIPADFDRPEWATSKYSRKEGESFAELFAIGHSRLTGPWDPAVLDRFEQVMS